MSKQTNVVNDPKKVKMLDHVASNKKISADLAHLSEPESPDPPKKKGTYKSFRLESNLKESATKLSESRVMSRTTLKMAE